MCRPFPSCPRHSQRHRPRHTPRHRARHTILNKNKKKKFPGVPRCRLAPHAHSARTAHTHATLGGLPAPGLRPSRATPSNPDRTIPLERIPDLTLQPCRCKNVRFVAKKWQKVWRFREKALSLRHGSRKMGNNRRQCPHEASRGTVAADEPRRRRSSPGARIRES